MYCKQCRKEVSNGKFCPECGERLVDENVAIENSNNSTPNKKKKNGGFSFQKLVSIFTILFILIAISNLGNSLESDDGQESNSGGFDSTITEDNDTVNNINDEETSQKTVISGDLYADVESGVLYSNENGKITDIDGNTLDVYNYLTVLENGAISEGECILEGVFAGAGGKIVIDMPGDVTYEDEVTNSRLEKLRKMASLERCSTDVIDTGYWLDLQQTVPDTEVSDDGSYFDEVVLGAWFDEYGSPIAASMPDKLSWAVVEHDGNDTALLSNFYFIDGERFSMDTLKRTSSNNLATYAMILVDIQKIDSGNGYVYFQGLDYISQTPVVVHGNFSGLLNGDDILLFAEFTGLASDDTPNFNGIYIEILNGLNIGY